MTNDKSLDKEVVMGPLRDTLRTTIYFYHIPPTLYNLTLVEYGRNLAKYGRTLRVAVDSILPHIAAYCRILPHIAYILL